MKGMQKIRRGKSFAGVALYALKAGTHHRSDPTVIGGNLLNDSAKDLIAEFDRSKQLRPEVEKAVWHNSLRLPCGESLTNEQWVSFANDYMQRMGFSDTHLRCYVLHDDEAGQHIHIIASRIDLNGGKLYLGRNENLISTRIISELEITHGLIVTKTAPSLSNAQPKRKRVSRNEKMLSERTGEPSPKEALQQLIDKSLADTPELLTFIKRLEEAEVSWTANIASTGKMNGFSFEFTGIAFKASQLGKKYSWANLQKLLNYEPERDNSLLLHTRPVVPAPAPAGMVIKTARETLTISKKIASLTPSLKASIALTPSLTPKTAVKEDKRRRIINAVLDLQNEQKIRNAKLLRFTPWSSLINSLKIYGFCLLYCFKKFKSILRIHALTPSMQAHFAGNLKRH